MHQQTMQQVVRGEMRLKVNCLSHENTRAKCLRVENIPRSEMFEIGANAATNDTASCARSNVVENVRCRHKWRSDAAESVLCRQKDGASCGR